MQNLISLTTFDFSTYNHSINVGIFSIGLTNELLDDFQDYNLPEIVAGNRFESEYGKISAMTLHIPNPENKVRFLAGQNIDPNRCVAVGDGYTDIPMLDWAKIPVLIDRTGRKQRRYADKNYHFVRSVPEILGIVKPI